MKNIIIIYSIYAYVCSQQEFHISYLQHIYVFPMIRLLNILPIHKILLASDNIPKSSYTRILQPHMQLTVRHLFVQRVLVQSFSSNLVSSNPIRLGQDWTKSFRPKPVGRKGVGQKVGARVKRSIIAWNLESNE